MKANSSALVQKVWSYAHVLKDDGLAFMDYTEQITYLLFLKMAWEQGKTGPNQIPARYAWNTLLNIPDNDQRLTRYHQALRKLSERPDLIGLIFSKPQSKINDPAKLNLLMQMIDTVRWSELDVDVKGDVYEGLLAKNADDVRGGAGQYFTPRPVIRAIVEVMQPGAGIRICDPACGTGGFLLAAYEYLRPKVTGRKQLEHLQTRAFSGTDLVPNVARLCAMNLFLHGIGTDPAHPVVSIGDSLEKPPTPVEMVLTNPPFGKKSSVTIVGASGKNVRDQLSYHRPDFWATTSNKQLNFLQHVYSALTLDGQAAVVVPDNVLFEGGAGEKIRRSLLEHCDVHTILRLPTGIWYSPGVKANVLFFEKRRLGKTPATHAVWIYDLRAGMNFSLRQNPITPGDLADFVASYRAGNRAARRQSDRFRRFAYADIMQRDGANLDIAWRLDSTAAIADTSPQKLLSDILGDLREAMDEFAAIEREIRE